MKIQELIDALELLRDEHGNAYVEDHRGKEIEVARFNPDTESVEVCEDCDEPCNDNNTHDKRR